MSLLPLAQLPRRSLNAAIAVALCLLLSAGPASAQQGDTDASPAPAPRTARVVDGERATTTPYILGPRGPLVALKPLVAHWRGRLRVGPLGERHELQMGDQTFLFGPGHPNLSVDGDLVGLSQTPRSAVGGIYVPLDFLDLTFSQLGVRFEWQEAPPTLTATRGGGRTYQVVPAVTTFGDVTTVVLEFAETPRYRVEERAGRAVVSFYGDQVAIAGETQRAGRLLGITAREGALSLRLTPGTGVRHYTLEQPFRLVMDLVADEGEETLVEETGEPSFVPPRRGRGPFTVVIDPGHGGESTGATGRSGIAEKTLTLQVARTLSDRLRGTGVRTVLTRSSDQDLSLTDRTAIANHESADLFVSLHVNSSYGRTAQGAETYFLSLEASDEDAAELAAREDEADSGQPNFANDLEFILWDLAQSHHLAESQRLAKLVQQEFSASLGLRDRGVKQAPFRVLRGANMPAVLVELGFISNPDEERLLQDGSHQQRLVDALARAIQAFRTSTPTVESATEPIESGASGP